MAMVRGHRRGAVQAMMIGLGIALLLGWSLLPIYWIAVTSLKGEREIYALPPTFVPHAPTLANYATVLFKTRFPSFIRNSVIVAVVTTLLSTIIGTLAAYAITRIRFIGRSVVARGIVVAYLLPPALLFIPLFIVLQRLGLIDSITGLAIACLT